MNEIGTNETIIVGGWYLNGSRMEADIDCKRIEWLIKTTLKRIASDESGWETLFQDKLDGRYWELYYPNSESHGVGPPSLKAISAIEVGKKYGIQDDT